MTTMLIQVVLVVTMFSEDAFNFALDLTSALTPDPVPAGGGVRAQAGRTRRPTTPNPRGYGRELVGRSWRPSTPRSCCTPPGRSSSCVSFIIYAPATVLFVMARREQGRQLFSPAELVILAVSVAGAVAGIIALATGWITI